MFKLTSALIGSVVTLISISTPVKADDFQPNHMVDAIVTSRDGHYFPVSCEANPNRYTGSYLLSGQGVKVIDRFSMPNHTRVQYNGSKCWINDNNLTVYRFTFNPAIINQSPYEDRD